MVGLKPTYGRVSRYGLSSVRFLAGSDRSHHEGCDGCGDPAGRDRRSRSSDSTSADVPVPDYLKALKRKDLKRLRWVFPREYFADGLDPEVEQAVRAAIEGLRELGADIREIKLPTTDAAVARPTSSQRPKPAQSGPLRRRAIRATGRREYGSAGDVFADQGRGIRVRVKRRIMLGTYVLSAGYRRLLWQGPGGADVDSPGNSSRPLNAST